MSFNTTLYRNEEEIEVEVEYNAYKGCRGHRNRFGVPEEPDEPPSVEIESVKNSETGEEIELDRSEEEKIEQEIWDYIADSAYDYPED